VQPFLAAAILAGRWDWRLIPALGFVLLGFVLREPCLVLARQSFVWRHRHPSTIVARRWMAAELALLALCATFLVPRIPASWLAGFSAAGAAFTAAAVWMTLRNRQRNRWFQAASAVAMGSTAPFAALCATGRLSSWVWLLWAQLALHAVASILIVHARLESRAAGRSVAAAPTPPAWDLALLPLAGLGFAWFHPALAVPPIVSAAALALELRLMASPAGLREPLTRVGIRTLLVSLTHMAVTIAALWPLARMGIIP
jgi:hypothetical protein